MNQSNPSQSNSQPKTDPSPFADLDLTETVEGLGNVDLLASMSPDLADRMESAFVEADPKVVNAATAFVLSHLYPLIELVVQASVPDDLPPSSPSTTSFAHQLVAQVAGSLMGTHEATLELFRATVPGYCNAGLEGMRASYERGNTEAHRLAGLLSDEIERRRKQQQQGN